MENFKSKVLELAQKSTFDYIQFVNEKYERDIKYLYPNRPSIAKRTRYKELLAYYKIKSAIAEAVNPRAILEIGVRLGYSAAAFLHKNPFSLYIGIDNSTLEVTNLDYANFILIKNYSQAKIFIHRNNSDIISDGWRKTFNYPLFDLIHIDGSHDTMSCYSDLYRAKEVSNVKGIIVVDDYFNNACPGVGRACKRFQNETNLPFCEIDSCRGNGEFILRNDIIY